MKTNNEKNGTSSSGLSKKGGSGAGQTPNGKKKPTPVPPKPKFTQKNPGDPGKFVWQTPPKNLLASKKAPQKPTMQAGSMPTFNLEFVPTTMYEYSMGLKNIEVLFNQYEDRAMFVSKPIKIDGNVMEIELMTSEEQPVFDEVQDVLSRRQTSIEYSIAFKDRPTANDWHPILPKDQTEVHGERLFFKGKEATLRFQADTSKIKVYENNIELKESLWSMQSPSVLWISRLVPNAIYTIDYTPNRRLSDPNKIEMLEHVKNRVKTKETFTGGLSHNNQLELSHYPYVDYAYINGKEGYDPNTDVYQPVRVSLKNASIVGANRVIHPLVEPLDSNGEVFTKNKTLYAKASWSDLLPYSLEPDGYHGFDYYQYKNRLTFTERFAALNIRENLSNWHGNADVEVEYEYLAASFRLKAVLRKNSGSGSTITPRLFNYQLLFKTMK